MKLLRLLCGAMLFIACADKGAGPDVQEQTGNPYAGMKMIAAENVPFSMGDPSAVPTLAHTVTIQYNYFMDATEVTQKEYVAVTGKTPWESADAKYQRGDAYPAYNVSWYDAVVYCNAKSSRDGLDPVYTCTGLSGEAGNGGTYTSVTADYAKSGYRLPFEWEWAFAAMGTLSTSYYWGDAKTDSVMDLYTWYERNADETVIGGVYGPNVTGTKLPNQAGLYDMFGNLWEWCENHYYEYTSVGEIITDPPVAPDGSNRVWRGGSWDNPPETFMTRYYRAGDDPSVSDPTLGFRTVARDTL